MNTTDITINEGDAAGASNKLGLLPLSALVVGSVTPARLLLRLKRAISWAAGNYTT